MKTLLIGLVLGMSLFALPAATYAAGSLIPCGGAGADQHPCQACDVVTLANNVIAWLVGFLSAIAVLIIVYAGIKLVTAGGNRHAMEEAKGMMTNLIIGYLIVLGGWLVMDYIMKALVNDDASFGPWNTISCVAQPKVNDYVAWSNPDASLSGNNGWTASGTSGASDATCGFLAGAAGMPTDQYDCRPQIAQCTAIGGTPTVNHPATGDTVTCTPKAYGGSCSPLASGPCSPENLVQYFGARATEASSICSKESGGAPIPSGSDICCGSDGSCSGDPSFSGGYFQINILSEASKIPGCNLSSFFDKNGTESAQGDCVKRGPPTTSSPKGICLGWSCTIVRGTAYNTCMQGTLNPAINFSIAKQLFSTRGFQPWSNSANRCNIPYK